MIKEQWRHRGIGLWGLDGAGTVVLSDASSIRRRVDLAADGLQKLPDYSARQGLD